MTDIKRSRIEAYDIAKGIGIILVYIGHVPPTHDIKTYIYSFHMPLFFFISGFFLNCNIGSREFLKKKVKTLLIPLLFFMSIPFTLHLLPGFDIFDVHIQMHSRYIGPLWFLQVLFVAEICVYSISKFRNLYKIATLISAIILALIIDFFNIDLPMLSPLPSAIVFVALGYYIKPELSKILTITKSMQTISVVVMTTFIWIVCVFSNSATNMHQGQLMDGVWGIVIALIGIYNVLTISKLLDSKSNCAIAKKMLIYCGKNSLIIYGLHYTLIKYLGLSGDMILTDPCRYLMINAIIILLIVGLIEIINKNLPWCIGRF